MNNNLSPQIAFSPLFSNRHESFVVNNVGPNSSGLVEGNEIVNSTREIRPGKSTLLAAGFNYVNSIVGAGVVRVFLIPVLILTIISNK
jgi:hypothetical protein